MYSTFLLSTPHYHHHHLITSRIIYEGDRKFVICLIWVWNLVAHMGGGT